MNSPTVLVAGSANMDLVTRVPHCPKPGETVLGSGFTTVPGGKGANQAVAAARLGAACHLAGCVGDDAFGALLREGLAGAGVGVDHLKTHGNEPTGTAAILVGDDGENIIAVTPSANLEFTPEDVKTLAPLFGKLDALLLQLEIPLDTVEAALDAAREHGVLSVLDAGPAQPLSERLIQKADLVSPNETEAEAITGIAVETIQDGHRAARKLLDMGAREVVVKLGSQGALYAGEDVLHVPAFEVNAIDTVAAGDAFTAALAMVWRELPRLEALRFANAAGALATMATGAQDAMPTRQAVEAFLKEQGAAS